MRKAVAKAGRIPPRNRKPEIALAGLSVVVVAAICSVRIEALWYPRNYLDMLLALILGVAVTATGAVGVILSLPKKTRLYGEEPRTARSILLLWVQRLSAVVAAVGATIAIAGALDLVAAPLLHRFDPIEWVMCLCVALLPVAGIIQSMRKNRASTQ